MKRKITFSRLSKKKQRIAIAKDTIKWVRTGIFKPKTNYYIEVKLPSELNIKFKNDDETVCNLELNKLLQDNKNVTCNVCAKGGMFMSHVMKTNHYSLQDAYEKDGDSTMKERLNKFFSEEQLDLIETAFEKQYRFYDRHISWKGYPKHVLSKEDRAEKKADKDKAKSAIAFGRRYKDSSKRLIEIMKNIIKNKGEFKPQIKTFVI